MKNQIVKILKLGGITFTVIFLLCLAAFKFEIKEFWLMIKISLPFPIFVMLVKALYEFVGHIGITKAKKERLSSIDKECKDYYRDILENNTPLVLALIDNFDISKSVWIAELLYLSRKNIIEFNDEKIIVLKKNKYLAKPLDKYVAEFIDENGKFIINNNNKNKILKEILDMAENDGLLKRKKVQSHTSTRVKIMLFLFLMAFISPIFGGLPIPGYVIFGFWAIFVGMFSFTIYYCKYTEMYDMSSYSIPYARSEKGEELNAKLEGLKNYLKDYSLMSEREAQEIELWDEYLIYSVMFGQNQKIVDEYEKYINIEEI